MKGNIKALTLTLFIFIFSISSFAQSGLKSGFDFTKKAAAREQQRWSLSEWMAMKERNHMMDMWLSMNMGSPYEFSLAGAYKSFKTKDIVGADEQSFTSYSGEFSAYAQFVGLTTEYENNTQEQYNDLAGLINLRLLGNSIQNTNFTLSLGQRTRHISTAGADVDLKQQFGQASLNLHITKYFGVEAKYRQYLKTNEDSYGKDIEEVNGEAGLFIDFNALRIFGAYYVEDLKMKDPGSLDEVKTKRTGIKSGIKFFF